MATHAALLKAAADVRHAPVAHCACNTLWMAHCMSPHLMRAFVEAGGMAGLTCLLASPPQVQSQVRAKRSKPTLRWPAPPCGTHVTQA